MSQIQATDTAGQGYTLSFDFKPDNCPLCHHAVDPKQLNLASVVGARPEERGAVLEMVFQCTRRDCYHFFVGRYKRRSSQANQMTGDFHLESTAPSSIVEPTLPKEVSEVSPNFAKVFSQAAVAETIGLDQIAGVGYRKALEFLVKDYCISEDPSAGESIRKEALGATISNRVADTHVKECAKRAAWLGNDETHYVRRWEDKDISDLKILIELTMSWIRSSVLTKRYLGEMSAPRN